MYAYYCTSDAMINLSQNKMFGYHVHALVIVTFEHRLTVLS